eukprot:6462482-Amphidinium_carterae.1
MRKKLKRTCGFQQAALLSCTAFVAVALTWLVPPYLSITASEAQDEVDETAGIPISFATAATTASYAVSTQEEAAEALWQSSTVSQTPAAEAERHKGKQREKLRIYVHTLPETFQPANVIRRFPDCASFQWANEYRLVKYILKPENKLLAADPAKADLFLVPFLAKCWFNFQVKYRLEKMSRDLNRLLEEMPARQLWHAQPAKHVFVFASGAGPTLIPDWQSLRQAIFVMAEGDLAAGFYA